MPFSAQSLDSIGWRSHFLQQLSLEELENWIPARVFSVQRTGVSVNDGDQEFHLPLAGKWFQLPAESRPTVGDWLLLDQSRTGIERVLDRFSLLKRAKAGMESELQLIGANIDTMLLVSSCNQEFNLARMERYLALAFDAGVHPVVVLTKADLVADAQDYQHQVETLGHDLLVEVVDATNPSSLAGLHQWCAAGQTVALLGSSGVGKSTLLNSLAGGAVQATGSIRDDDGKGRHTTTHRSLHRLPAGGLVLDSPGMRELQLADQDAGVAQLFEDIEALISRCRFSNCEHDTEPGCAVLAAIASGELSAERLQRYHKLQREEVFNSENLAQRRARMRNFSKKVKQAMPNKNRRLGKTDPH